MHALPHLSALLALPLIPFLPFPAWLHQGQHAFLKALQVYLVCLGRCSPLPPLPSHDPKDVHLYVHHLLPLTPQAALPPSVCISPSLSVTHFALPSTPEPLPEPPADLLPTQDPCADDAGKYKCIAMNHFGEATANVNLNIEAEPEPKGQAPVFVEKPSIKFEEKAARVLMEALVRADPKPTSAWSKNGKQLDAARVTASVTLEKEELYRIRLILRVTSALCSSSFCSSSPPAPYNLRCRCLPLSSPAAV